MGTLQSLPHLIEQGGFFPLGAADIAAIIGKSWAAFDLLPPDPQQTEMRDAEGDLNLFTYDGGRLPRRGRSERAVLRLAAQITFLRDLNMVSCRTRRLAAPTACFEESRDCRTPGRD